MSHRMQITLDDAQYVALSDESRRSGASIAELIRQAVAGRFMVETADERAVRFRRALQAASGVWAHRPDGGQVYQRKARTALAARATRRTG